MKQRFVKTRTDKSKASVLYGLGIAKAPVLVTFSAGFPQQRQRRRVKRSVRGATDVTRVRRFETSSGWAKGDPKIPC